MKVVFVSTYPPAPCGIGDYTRQLRHAVERARPDLSIDVVAERHPKVDREWDAQVDRIWQRRSAWQDDAARAVIARRPAAVHVQHEEAILHQNGQLMRFLEAVGAAGIARVVTLHSVYRGRVGLPFWWPPALFHRALAARCEAIVVHQNAGGRDDLERQGVPPGKVHVIPHGTTTLPPVSREAARQRLKIPLDAKVALFFGIIHPKKNLHTALAAAARVAARLPSFRFLVAGSARRRGLLDALYARRLARAMAPGLAAGWLDVRNGFIPADDLPSYLAAADVVLFPHDQSYGSASGVFHLALAAGRSSICSTSLKFAEARAIFARHNPGAIVAARDVAAWAASIETLLGDAPLRADAEALARAAAAETSWDRIGVRYGQLYDQVTAGAGAPS